MPILSVINQKGGVGKTTTAVNLAAGLAQTRRVLLVDLDPQANATSGLGIEKSDTTVYDVLAGEASARRAALPTDVENLFVLPASTDLAGAAIEIDESEDDVNLLKKGLLVVRASYDVILVDAPPSMGALTLNALVAADALIVPVQTEYYALEGIAQMLDTIERIKASLNPELDVLGILLTMFDSRTNLSDQVEANVREHLEQQVFDTVIPRNVRLAEAPSYGQSIFTYAPSSTGALAYEALAEEVLNRVAQR